MWFYENIFRFDWYTMEWTPKQQRSAGWELPGDKKSTTQIPRVKMDKTTEQRISVEEVTWNFNVHATQLRFTRKPWSRRLRLIASRIPCAKYPLRTPVICFFAGVAFFKTQQWAHFGLQRVASLGASESWPSDRKFPCGTGSVFPGAGTRYIGAEGLVPGTKWFEPPRAGQQQNALARRHLYQPLGPQRALYFGDFRKGCIS